jgi:hypothetical protein
LVVEAGAAVVFAAEQEAGTADGVHGDEVPGIFGDDVGGDEVDFTGAVRDGAAGSAAVSVDPIESKEKLGGSFDLDAPEQRCEREAGMGLACVEYEVVAFAVSVGFADGEAHAGGDELEDEFGELSATLGGEFSAEGMDGRDSPQARRGKASVGGACLGHFGKKGKALARVPGCAFVFTFYL